MGEIKSGDLHEDVLHIEWDLEAKEEVRKKEVREEDLQNVLDILENFGKSETGRLKLDVSSEEKTNRKYHLGRCDVGSPWADGTCI